MSQQQTKVLSRQPKGEEFNSLNHWADQMADEPHAVYIAVTWYGVDEVGERTKTGERVPKLVMVRNEVVGTTKHCPLPVIDAALHAMNERTGKEPLPFEQTDA